MSYVRVKEDSSSNDDKRRDNERDEERMVGREDSLPTTLTHSLNLSHIILFNITSYFLQL